jgi:two-component system nitrogen regulation response regulator GlnG
LVWSQRTRERGLANNQQAHESFMSAYPDADLTLPSVVAALPGGYRERDLTLTIIFHPSTSRIGEKAILPCQGDAVPIVFGRCHPVFGRRPDQAGTSLVEGHVSRRAFELIHRGDTVTLRRLPASSRCRVGGQELTGVVELDRTRLERGVPILLGHSVVLLLRLVTRSSPVAALPLPGSGLLGGSAYMAGLHDQIAQFAGIDLDVLIRGETGTGKELVATAIHRASGRAQGSLVSVNMAAIPPGLAAATLFGSARGAFTGASKASEGYFLQAQAGTLFLDEIGDTPPEIQPQLLRALQQREIQAVGGAIRRVDVRVVSATDAVLEGEACDFKAALRHRLGACEIHLLPLREHPEDIGELLMHFLATASSEAGFARLLPSEHTAAPEIAHWAELFHSFLCHTWPGNVRELANYAAQLVLASGRGLTLPGSVHRALQAERSVTQDAMQDAPGAVLRKIKDVDQAEFDNAWQVSAYEVANTARHLGVSRQAVYRRVEKTPGYRLAGEVPQDELERELVLHGGDSNATAMALKVSLSGLRERLRGSGLAWF